MLSHPKQPVSDCDSGDDVSFVVYTVISVGEISVYKVFERNTVIQRTKAQRRIELIKRSKIESEFFLGEFIDFFSPYWSTSWAEQVLYDC